MCVEVSFVFNLTKNHWCMLESMKKLDWIVNHPYLQVHMQGVGLGCKKTMHVAITKCVQCASHGTIQKLAIMLFLC